MGMTLSASLMSPRLRLPIDEAEQQDPVQPLLLSARHLQVLRLAALGLHDYEIGGRLNISGQTVRHHLQHIRRQMQARNTTHAVALAVAMGLIVIENQTD